MTKGHELEQGLKQFAKAKSPIDPKQLGFIPYFSTIFPDKDLWATIVRLSGNDALCLV